MSATMAQSTASCLFSTGFGSWDVPVSLQTIAYYQIESPKWQVGLPGPVLSRASDQLQANYGWCQN